MGIKREDKPNFFERTKDYLEEHPEEAAWIGGGATLAWLLSPAGWTFIPLAVGAWAGSPSGRKNMKELGTTFLNSAMDSSKKQLTGRKPDTKKTPPSRSTKRPNRFKR